MHDLDRTMQELEFDQEYDEFEYGDQMEYDGEYNDEYDGEYNDEYDAEYNDEYADESGDYEYESDDEYDSEYDLEGGVLFSEEEEMELASDLLNVNNEEELNEFWRRVARRARRRLRKFGRGLKKVGRGAFKVIKAVAKKALPIAGGVVGGMFGGPMGAKLGGMAGGAASRMFELELEGMSPEDREFEVARRMVRFAGAATKNAAQLGQRMPANKAIKTGFKAAAKKHAPGLLKPHKSRRTRTANSTGANKGRIVRSGRWIMRGDNRIVILGL